MKKLNNLIKIILIFLTILVANSIYNKHFIKPFPDYQIAGRPDFSSDGSMLYAATLDGTFLWNTQAGEIEYKKLFRGDCMHSQNQAAISSDNRYFAFNKMEYFDYISPNGIFQNNIFIYDLKKKEYIYTETIGFKGKMGFSPDGDYFVIPNLYLLDIKTLKKTEIPETLEKDSCFLTLNTAVEGNWFVSQEKDSIHLLSLPAFEGVKTINYDFYNIWDADFIESELFTGDGQIYINKYDALETIDFEKERIFRVDFQTESDMKFVCISYDGSIGACHTPIEREKDAYKYHIMLFEPNSGDFIKNFTIFSSRYPSSFAISNKSGLLAVVYEGYRNRFLNIGSYPFTIVLYDIDTGKKVRTLEWK